MIRWSILIAAAFAAVALLLNHAMLTGNAVLARACFYGIAAGLPAGIIAAARALRRAHFDSPPDDSKEISEPVLVGAVIFAVIHLISAVAY